MCFYYLELLVKWELLTNHYKTDFSPLKFLTRSPLQKGPPTKAFLLEVTSNTETSLPTYLFVTATVFHAAKNTSVLITPQNSEKGSKTSYFIYSPHQLKSSTFGH